MASIWNLGFLSYSLATRLERLGVPVVLVLCDDWICWAHEFDAWTRMFERRSGTRRGRWAARATEALALLARRPAFDVAKVVVASEMIGDWVARTCPWRFEGAPVVRLGVETRSFPVSAPPGRPLR